MTDVFINEYERVDDLNRKGYKIIQDPKRFCFGIDAVLLSGFANVKKGETAIDLGTGTGIIPILLEAKTEGKHFIGIEIQAESVEMAQRSVKMNDLCEKIDIVQCDIKNVVNMYEPSSFNVVTSNPPYMNDGGGIKNDFTPKAIARHEILCSLEDVISSAARLLKTTGRFYMVHRPHRLADIMAMLRQYKLEPKRLRMIHSYIDKEPSMVLIEACKNGKPWLNVMPPLIVYDKEGKYAEEVYKIYYE